MEVFDHLSVVIVGVSDAEFGQAQASGFAVRWRLQDVFRGQSGCGAVTQGEGVFEELDDVGFGLQVRRAVSIV